VRSRFRADGRDFAAAPRTPVAVPVLHLRGADDVVNDALLGWLDALPGSRGAVSGRHL